MKLLNHGGDIKATGHFLKLNQVSYIGKVLYLIELLVKGLQRNLQTNRAIAKAIVCSPQTVSKPSLTKTIPKEFVEHGKAELMPT